jgi:hypothetical protein
MGISQQGFFLHRYRGALCTHDLLVRVWYPAYSNADQGAEDAALAFGESAAQHLRTWWERYELRRICSQPHQPTLLGEVSEPSVEWADDDEEPVFGPGLRTLTVWVAPQREPFLELASEPFDGATRHEVFLLTDEDGRGDLSAA